MGSHKKFFKAVYHNINIANNVILIVGGTVINY